MSRVSNTATTKVTTPPGQASRTWTFQPDDDVRSLMDKAIHKALREARVKGVRLTTRGLKTEFLNAAFRNHFGALRGKREG